MMPRGSRLPVAAAGGFDAAAEITVRTRRRLVWGEGGGRCRSDVKDNADLENDAVSPEKKVEITPKDIAIFSLESSLYHRLPLLSS